MCVTLNAEQLGLATPDNYAYLSQSGTYTVEGTNDVQEFKETMKGNNFCTAIFVSSSYIKS